MIIDPTEFTTREEVLAKLKEWMAEAKADASIHKSTQLGIGKLPSGNWVAWGVLPSDKKGELSRLLKKKVAFANMDDDGKRRRYVFTKVEIIYDDVDKSLDERWQELVKNYEKREDDDRVKA